VRDLNSSGVGVGSWHKPEGETWVDVAARFTGAGAWESLGSLGGSQSVAEGFSSDGTLCLEGVDRHC